MEERLPHVSVVIGATPLAESVRRWLSRRGVTPVGVTSQLRGLRRTLLLADADAVSMYVSLDASTMERYGRSLGQLIEDARDWSVNTRTVGLMHCDLPLQDVATLGLDMYVESIGEVADIVRRTAFADARWRLTPTITRQRCDWLSPLTARFGHPTAPETRSDPRSD